MGSPRLGTSYKNCMAGLLEVDVVPMQTSYRSFKADLLNAELASIVSMWTPWSSYLCAFTICMVYP